MSTTIDSTPLVCDVCGERRVRTPSGGVCPKLGCGRIVNGYDYDKALAAETFFGVRAPVAAEVAAKLDAQGYRLFVRRTEWPKTRERKPIYQTPDGKRWYVLRGWLPKWAHKDHVPSNLLADEILGRLSWGTGWALGVFRRINKPKGA